jgi:hypothetical protein
MVVVVVVVVVAAAAVIVEWSSVLGGVELGDSCFEC